MTLDELAKLVDRESCEPLPAENARQIARAVLLRVAEYFGDGCELWRNHEIVDALTRIATEPPDA